MVVKKMNGNHTDPKPVAGVRHGGTFCPRHGLESKNK